MKSLFTMLFAAAALSLSAQTVYFSQDFENSLPAGWTADASWQYGQATALGSQYFPLTGNSTRFYAVNDDKLGSSAPAINGSITTGPIDLTAATGQFLLMFDSYWINGDDSGKDETAHVEVSEDGGTTWTLFWDLLKTGKWGLVAKDCSSWAGKTVQLRFTYSDGAGWNFGWGIDNLRIGEPSHQKEVAVKGFFLTNETAIIGKQLPAKIVVHNNGAETITDMDLSVTYAGSTNAVKATGLNIPFLEDGIVTIPMKFEYKNGSEDLTVLVSGVNNAGDDDDTDNETTMTLTGVAGGVPGRKILVEEATGRWCTWCPRGTVALDKLNNGFDDNFVGIAVHNNDPMTLAAYNSGLAATAFPNVQYMRTGFIDPSEIEAKFLDDMNVDPEAHITGRLAYDATTNKVKVSVDVTPLTALAGTYRVFACLTEDGMHGTDAPGALWSQVNAYSGGGNGPMGGFEYLTSPVPAPLMVYDHVGRQLISSFAGTSNLLPTTMDAGALYQVDLAEKTLAAGLNLANVHLVVALVAPDKSIVNADGKTWDEALNTSGTHQPVLDARFASVSPNLFADETFVRLKLDDAVNVNIDVFNSVGELVSTRNYGKQLGDQVFPFNAGSLPNDTYYFEVTAGNQVGTYKAVLAR